MKLFTASDAEPHWDTESGFPIEGKFISIDRANAILAEKLRECETVYGGGPDSGRLWDGNQYPADTHKGKLLCIVPVDQKWEWEE